MIFLFSMFVARASDVSITTKTSSSHVLVEVFWPADKINERHISADGQKWEDSSSLYCDLDMDGKESLNDIRINLNISPEYPGMYMDQYGKAGNKFVWFKKGAIDSPSHILHDKKGRHDTFLIPLEKIGSLSKIQIRYEGESPADKLQILSSYQSVSLIGSDSIDVASIVDDRFAKIDKAGNIIKTVAQLNVGDVAPALHAKEWIGEEPTGIRVLAFWATWCGPCVATIPKLNQLASEGINVVGLNEQNIKHIQKFQKRKKMNYPQATSSNSIQEFGLEGKGLPWYFILDGNNRVLWVGEKIVVEEVHAIIHRNKNK